MCTFIDISQEFWDKNWAKSYETKKETKKETASYRDGTPP